MSDFGLVILAPHRQGAEPGELESVAKAAGIKYTISDGTVSGGSGGGIPHAFLFDAEGKCVHEGAAAGLEKKLRAALGASFVTRTGRKEFSRALMPHVDALKAGQSPTAILGKLQTVARAADAESMAQAKQLIEAMTASAKTSLAAAKDRKDDDPLGAYDQAQRLANTFKNTAIGTEAAKLVADWKNDKKIAAELRARPLLEKIKALDQSLHSRLGERDPKDPMVQKAIAPQLRQLRDLVGQIKRSGAETKAAQEAIALGEKYGVTIK